jgi:hypothetical protein
LNRASHSRSATLPVTPTGTLYHSQNSNSMKIKKGADFMQIQKNKKKKINAQSSRFCQRICSTVYTVNIHFKEGSKETLEDKMYRMMKSDLNNGRFCGNIILPQADALPERGSV